MCFIGITMGDPAGIGPEITLKALTSNYEFKSNYVIYGSYNVLEYYRNLLSLKTPLNKISQMSDYRKGAINIINVEDINMGDFEIGKVSSKCGDAAFKYISAAIKDAIERNIKAVVTGPINKEALQLSGHKFEGHTEIFAKLTNTSKYSMMLIGGPLKVIHVSTHISLKKACENINKERILDVINLANVTLKKMGINEPTIAVAGLNPHAGESGIFGSEEIDEIIPAIKIAQENGIKVEGPIPADVVFLKAIKGKYDIVVAMYHDQGHIPIKLLGFETGVNITVGLPIVRTSVDHGTAFDIAGKGIADEKSMIEAMKTAEMFY